MWVCISYKLAEEEEEEEGGGGWRRSCKQRQQGDKQKVRGQSEGNVFTVEEIMMRKEVKKYSKVNQTC